MGSVTVEFLRSNDIEGVIWDIDGTLMNYHDTDIAAEFRDHIRELFKNGPSQHSILSNCDEVRYPELGKMFPEIPVLRGYTTPSGPVLRVLHSGGDSHTADQVAGILRSGEVLRKPSGKLVEMAMQHLGIVDKKKMMIVGDQYLTDIASGNMAGILTTKVPAWGKKSFPLKLRFSQRLEQGLFHLRHLFSTNATRKV